MEQQPRIKSTRDVMKIVKEYEIRHIHIWFTDILGLLKSFTITPSELELAFSEGMGFDGSSIEGFARIEESDMVAMPDPLTFQILPWSNYGGLEARLFCDVLLPDGTHYDGDPRYCLKRGIQKASDLGYKLYLGPELEFFLFKNDRKPIPLDNCGYFDTIPLDQGNEIRIKCVDWLHKAGIQVEYSHHEVAKSQHEIDLRYDEALKMADKTITYRAVVKEAARSQGVFASFMPKPLPGVNGSGMHTHQSLFKGSENQFYDPNDPWHLSKMAKQYLAGLLRHSREICAVTNQWVNSYKRLVIGYEAPVYISWAMRNRSTMIRIPMMKPGKGSSTRIEYRSPDPACNPYLAFAVMLAAGLKGVQEDYPLPNPYERDIYAMTEEERCQEGIVSLPGNLYEAIQELEKSDLVREALGEHIFHQLIKNKKKEWEVYNLHVTQHEIDHFFPIL